MFIEKKKIFNWNLWYKIIPRIFYSSLSLFPTIWISFRLIINRYNFDKVITITIIIIIKNKPSTLSKRTNTEEYCCLHVVDPIDGYPLLSRNGEHGGQSWSGQLSVFFRFTCGQDRRQTHNPPQWRSSPRSWIIFCNGKCSGRPMADAFTDCETLFSGAKQFRGWNRAMSSSGRDKSDDVIDERCRGNDNYSDNGVGKCDVSKKHALLVYLVWLVIGDWNELLTILSCRGFVLDWVKEEVDY